MEGRRHLQLVVLLPGCMVAWLDMCVLFKRADVYLPRGLGGMGIGFDLGADESGNPWSTVAST